MMVDVLEAGATQLFTGSGLTLVLLFMFWSRGASNLLFQSRWVLTVAAATAAAASGMFPGALINEKYNTSALGWLVGMAITAIVGFVLLAAGYGVYRFTERQARRSLFVNNTDRWLDMPYTANRRKGSWVWAVLFLFPANVAAVGWAVIAADPVWPSTVLACYLASVWIAYGVYELTGPTAVTKAAGTATEIEFDRYRRRVLADINGAVAADFGIGPNGEDLTEMVTADHRT